MSSYFDTISAAILPPRQGEIRVLALTTSASAVQDTGIAAGGQTRFVTVVSNVDAYITFSDDGTNTITDPDETNTSTDARTWLLTAGVPQPFTVSPVERYFKAKGSAAGYLRWYVSSR